MKLVVDANVLFSAFIKEGFVRRLILHDLFELYAPRFVIEEFFEHSGELSKKTGIDKESLHLTIKEFLARSSIKLYSKKDIIAHIEKATSVSPDIDDSMYIAAALTLNCPIWSNDKRLKEQNTVEVYSTKELLDFMKDYS